MSITAAERRYHIHRLMIDSRLSLRARMQSMWHFVLTCELQDGTQFLRSIPDNQLYVVIGSTGKIASLPRSGRGGDGWFSYLHTVYGLGERENFAKFMYDSMRPYVHDNGTRVELRRFAVYKTDTQTAYLSQYNGRMWKIEGDGPNDISTVALGEDGVFFADDDPAAHTDVEIEPHGILLDTLLNINFAPAGISGITPEQQRMAMTIWIFALAFPDLMPTKPIVVFEGAPGAGKSLSLQLIQHAFMGISRPMILSRNKEDDFGVVLLRAPIAVFDNTDSYIEWVPDAICAYATTGVWTKRKLFTDEESITLKPHAFIAIASKNPASFRREDVVDRLIVVRLDRRDSFTSAEALIQHVREARPRLLGEYLWYVGQIVKELRASLGEAEELETSRMADFAAFARVVGRVMGWAPQDLKDLMQAMQNERAAFANEEDPLIDVLSKWVAYKTNAASGRQGNVGRLVAAFQLNSELETIAQSSGIPWKHTARSLAQKLRSPYVEHEFHVETITMAGQKAYRLYRNSDPRLSIITDEKAKP